MGKLSTITQEQFRCRFIYNPKEDLLGTGGFAKVYKAYDSKHKKSIALKLFTGDNNTRYNIAREMQQLQKMPPHENLVQCHEVFEVESGNVDIHGNPINYQAGILEYANHGTLDDLMKTDIPESLKKKLLKDILLGLQHLHNHKIVHRDLKPRNILIHNEGGILTAKITDFGIAKALEHTDTTQSTTGMIGTVEYMAPEQIVPEQFGENDKINHKADLWSFGVLLFHWISGKSLYEGNSTTTGNAQLIKAVLEGVPEEKINKLSSPYKEIIRSCLVQKAAERIDSAALLIKQLERPESRPPTPDGKKSKYTNNQLSVLITVISLILIVASFGSLYLYHNNKVNTVIPQDTLLETTPNRVPTSTVHIENKNIIQIGNQIWMIKNLDVSSFRNGDPIPEARTDAEWLAAGRAGQPAWCYYDNDPSNGSTYGKLYNWYAVNDPRGLAPEGWHVASDMEWSILTNALGGEKVAGGKLKSAGYWKINRKLDKKVHAVNGSGFTGLPGGTRELNGKFSGVGSAGHWWSSTENSINANLVWMRYLYYYSDKVNRLGNASKDEGLSVRCIKD